MAPLPQSIMRQLAEADELQGQLNSGNQPPAFLPEPEPEIQAAPTPQQTAPPPPAQPTLPQLPPPPQGEAYWENRFKVLQGKYDAEVPRLAAQLRELQARIQAPAPQAPTPASVPVTRKSRITDEEQTTYGSELLDVVGRKAQDILETALANQAAAFETRMAAVVAQNEALAAQVRGTTEVVAQTQAEKYWEALEKALPNYREINDHPQFRTWLAGVDPYTGSVRQAILDDTFNKLDATRTLAMFNGWLQTLQQTPQPPPPAPTPPPPPTPAYTPVPYDQTVQSVPAVRSEVQRQVTPQATNTVPPPSNPNDRRAKIWQAAEVDQVYTDLTKGRYTAEQAKRMDAEISLAVAEGRVSY